MRKNIYMDYLSLTPMDERVYEKMFPFLRNEVSRVRMLEEIELSRERLSRLLSCSLEEIVFTSGKREAVCLAVFEALRSYAWKGKHIVVFQIGGSIVMEICNFLKERGYSVSRVSVDRHGRISPEDFKKALREDTVLVNVPLASADIGTLQPLSELSKIAKERGVLLHVDGIPGLTWVESNPAEIGADLMTISSPHLYGPGGVGALYVSRNIDFEVPSFFKKDEIENAAGIVGFGVAAEILLKEREEEIERVKKLRDFLEDGIREKINGVFFCGHKVQRLPGVLSICVSYMDGEILTHALLEEGIEIGRTKEEVLIALGIPPELSKGGIVLSLGRWSTIEDVESFLSVFPGVIDRLRRMTT